MLEHSGDSWRGTTGTLGWSEVKLTRQTGKEVEGPLMQEKAVNQSVEGNESRDTGSNARMGWKLVLAGSAVCIWLSLLLQLRRAEQEWTTWFLVGLICLFIAGWAVRRFAKRRRTSLSFLVVVAPILGALCCVPIRVAFTNRQLAQRLQNAGVSEYELICVNGISPWLQSAARNLAGNQVADQFNGDLISVRSQLSNVDPILFLRLPTKDLNMVSLRRSGNEGVRITAEWVDWMNTIPKTPLVSLRLNPPDRTELMELSQLRHSTMLKLRTASLADLELNLPSVYDLQISDSDLSGRNRPRSLHLPSLERFHLIRCKLDDFGPLVESLERAAHVAVSGCQASPTLLQSILDLDVPDLVLSELTVPDEFNFSPSSKRIGRSLTLWNCEISGEQLIGLLARRRTSSIQLELPDAISVQHMNRLFNLPDLHYVRIAAPWLTSSHLKTLTLTEKRMKISVLDCTLKQEEIRWLQANKGPNVNLYFQLAHDTERADASKSDASPASTEHD